MSSIREGRREARTARKLWWWRDYTRPHTPFQVRTPDGVTIRGVRVASGHDTLAIYCHGFLSGKNYTGVPRFVELLADKMDAIAFDFRGHGESQGFSTLSQLEMFDLDAVMGYAAQFKYRRILLVGSSMGGAVAIRYAAEHPAVGGVATIGAFARPQFTRLGMLGLMLARLPLSRNVVGLVRQARIGSIQVEHAPVDVIGKLSPRPVLLFQGQLDPLVPSTHARALYEEAGKPRELYMIPRGSHDIPNLNRRTRDMIANWVDEFIIASPLAEGR